MKESMFHTNIEQIYFAGVLSSSIIRLISMTTVKNSKRITLISMHPNKGTFKSMKSMYDSFYFNQVTCCNFFSIPYLNNGNDSLTRAKMILLNCIGLRVITLVQPVK